MNRQNMLLLPCFFLKWNMVHCRLYILLLFVLPVLSSCENKQEVDLIIQNAKIYTVDQNFNVVQGAAILDGRFVAVGPDATINARYTSDKKLNLRGKFIFPGFIDAHSHFSLYAETLNQVDLTGSRSKQEITDRLKQKSPSAWLIGFGWDQNLWDDKTMPDNQWLNENFPAVPVFLWRIDGHAALLNSEAIRLMKINLDTKIEGGAIEQKNGQLTGLIFENAAVDIFERIPKPEKDQMEKLLVKAQQDCFAVGLTTVCEAGLNYLEVVRIDSLQKAGKLQLPVYIMLNPTPENFRNYVVNGPFMNDRLHISAVKVFIDGSLGSRGALLLQPYTDMPQKQGMLCITGDSLLKICQQAYQYNFQVCGHAIGDSANRFLLTTYAKVLPVKNTQRWRVEHAQVVNPTDVPLFGQYGIIPSVQTSHYLSDKGWAIDRLGPVRMKQAYAWQDLLRQNNWLANGSDFPVEGINPLRGFYAAVTRIENPPVPKKQEQHLTRVQALKAMTIWAAMAQFEETQKGSLEPGKWADFVILDKNIMAIHPSEIMSVTIEQTWCHGKLVYRRDSLPN